MSGSALHEAAIGGKAEIAKILLQHGIDLTIKDGAGQVRHLQTQKTSFLSMAHSLSILLFFYYSFYYSCMYSYIYIAVRLER